MAHLAQGVLAALLVHLVPGLLLEDGSSGGHLSDDAKGVLLHVLHHGAELARARALAVGVQVPERLAEVAVLVVQEDEVQHVVGALSSVLELNEHQVRADGLTELIELLDVVSDPVAEALVAGALDLGAHAVEALEDASPQILAVAVDVLVGLPLVDVADVGRVVSGLLGQLFRVGDGCDQKHGSESFHYQKRQIINYKQY